MIKCKPAIDVNKCEKDVCCFVCNEKEACFDICEKARLLDKEQSILGNCDEAFEEEKE